MSRCELAPAEALEAEALEAEELVAVLARNRSRFRKLLGYQQIPERDREDLVQQAALLTWAARGRIETAEGFLLGTLRRLCSRYHRTRHRREALTQGALLSLEELPELAHCAAPEPPLSREAKLSVRQGLARLPETPRGLLVAVYFQDVCAGLAASRMGYSATGGRVLVARARERLRSELTRGPERRALVSRPKRG